MREWWRGGVIYQVYPRSFQDSDRRWIGDLPGIMRRLDHIASLGVDAIWLVPHHPVAASRHGLRRVRTTKRSTASSAALEDFDDLVKRAHALGLKVIMDQVLSHLVGPASLVPREPAQPHQLTRPTGTSGPIPSATARRPTTGRRCSAAVPGSGTPAAGSTTSTISSIEQPDLNFHNPEVQDAVLDVLRFWLERGVDGFRLDTVNYYFHEQGAAEQSAGQAPQAPALCGEPVRHAGASLRQEPAGECRLHEARAQTHAMEFPVLTTVGEVGDSHKGLQLMAEYTGRWRQAAHGLHLRHARPRVHRRAFPRQDAESSSMRAGDGWPCWSLHQPRRRSPYQLAGPRREASPIGARAPGRCACLIAPSGAACSITAKSSACLQADILFEELIDPPGIRFGLTTKAATVRARRSYGTRGRAPNGFTNGKLRLPVHGSFVARGRAAAEGRGLDAQLLSQGARLPPSARRTDR